MTTKEILKNWNALKKKFPEEKELFQEMEEDCAFELACGTDVIPEIYLKESGFDPQTEDENDIFTGKKRLRNMIAYFCCSSTASKITLDSDGKNRLEITFLNGELFGSLLGISLAAELWEAIMVGSHFTKPETSKGTSYRVTIVLADAELNPENEELYQRILKMFPNIDHWEIVDDVTGDPEDAFGNNWNQELDTEIKKFFQTKDYRIYLKVLTLLMNGMAYQEIGCFPLSGESGYAPENIKCLESSNGDRYLVMLTRPNSGYDDIRGFHMLHSFLVFEDEQTDISGLVINPEEENLVIEREFFKSAFGLFKAGIILQKEMDKAETDGEEDDFTDDYYDESYEDDFLDDGFLETPRPISKETFEEAKRVVMMLEADDEDSVLRIKFTENIANDDVIGLQMYKTGYQYEIILITEADGKLDTITASNVPLPDAIEFLKQFGLAGRRMDEIGFMKKYLV